MDIKTAEFYQDNASSHTSKSSCIIRKLQEKLESSVHHLIIFQLSPDISIIECCAFGLLKKAFCKAPTNYVEQTVEMCGGRKEPNSTSNFTKSPIYLEIQLQCSMIIHNKVYHTEKIKNCFNLCILFLLYLTLLICINTF